MQRSPSFLVPSYDQGCIVVYDVCGVFCAVKSELIFPLARRVKRCCDGQRLKVEFVKENDFCTRCNRYSELPMETRNSIDSREVGNRGSNISATTSVFPLCALLKDTRFRLYALHFAKYLNSSVESSIRICVRPPPRPSPRAS